MVHLQLGLSFSDASWNAHLSIGFADVGSGGRPSWAENLGQPTIWCPRVAPNLMVHQEFCLQKMSAWGIRNIPFWETPVLAYLWLIWSHYITNFFTTIYRHCIIPNFPAYIHWWVQRHFLPLWGLIGMSSWLYIPSPLIDDFPIVSPILNYITLYPQCHIIPSMIACTYIYNYICIYIYICMYVCRYICTYIYTLVYMNIYVSYIKNRYIVHI
jgi:hypothetical protein